MLEVQSGPRHIGESLLLELGRLGVDYFFANPGTEFASLIEGFANLKKQSVPHPKPVTVPHEFLAVNMAYGAYLATGRAQAVMGHVTVGTANAALGIMNASRMHIPLIFLAGRTPVHETGIVGHRDKFIHWAQESYDQGGMIREYCKWDYELRSGDMLGQVLQRAYSIAMTEPRGPVHLILPREILLQPSQPERVGFQLVSAEPARPDAAAMAKVMEWLSQAKKPLIVTSRGGSHPDNVNLLAKVCETLRIPVLSPNAQYANLPSDHPYYAGTDLGDRFHEVDCLIVLDTDVPWCPLENGPSESCTVIHVGPEPLFDAIPIRSHRADLSLISSVHRFLADLLALADSTALSSRSGPWISRAPLREVSSRLTADAVAAHLGRRWTRDMVLFNELSLPIDAIPIREPGSYFRSGSASGLGWALSCALGFKMARPEKRVISVVGDGVYYFSNPLAAHWLAIAHGLSTLTIVLNNSGYGSIRQATEKYFPGAGAEDLPLTSLRPSLPFHDVFSAAGGHGELASTNQEFERALERCLSMNEPTLINASLDT